ncbi:MAG: GIY-YIG nuclease family protein [Bryobacteraceae bacterium]|nr:GIY-YIG nuclease family protein [Bryobacteraceae bacterium]
MTDAPGSYLLVLALGEPAEVAVGALGAFSFPAGLYLYAGSARGPGGIRARAGRHLRGDGAVRWHIDWLRRRAKPVALYACPGRRRLECIWAAALRGQGAFAAPAPGFGSSDCRCPSHLWHTGSGMEDVDAVVARLPRAPGLVWQDGVVSWFAGKEAMRW